MEFHVLLEVIGWVIGGGVLVVELAKSFMD